MAGGSRGVIGDSRRAVPASPTTRSCVAGGTRVHQAHPPVVGAGMPWILWGDRVGSGTVLASTSQAVPIGSMVTASKWSIRTSLSACQAWPAFPAET